MSRVIFNTLNNRRSIDNINSIYDEIKIFFYLIIFFKNLYNKFIDIIYMYVHKYIYIFIMIIIIYCSFYDNYFINSKS